MPPQLHCTPPEAVAATVREIVAVGSYCFHIERPADPAAVFAHSGVKAAQAADEYLPHWVKLWAVGRMLAEAVVAEPWQAFSHTNGDSPLEALELGSGLGLAGLAALARGLAVTFSDVDETALAFAARNARLNGFTNFRTLSLDFRTPPSDLRFPIIMASDVIYQDRLVRPLVTLLKRVLTPDGLCLITDQNRPDGPRFLRGLGEAGLTVETSSLRPEATAGTLVEGTLYRIRHAQRKSNGRQ
jgi:predicted nicotinamide N-methyase